VFARWSSEAEAVMGEKITFPSNGTEGSGYLAMPAGGEGPGVLVIQEWWGLVDHICDVCDRFANEGFVALAPDLYRGMVAREPDEATKLMMGLALERAGKDLSGALDELARRSGRERVGVVGFCMGGGLALVVATQRPDRVGAVVPFYGVIPWSDLQPDYAKLAAPVLGHYAELDHSAPPEQVRALEARLRELGKSARLEIHPGCDHAFFNDTRPEVYNAAEAASAWSETLEFLRQNLGA